MVNTIIVVNNEPYCIWEHDIIGRNNEFLESIDMDYFDYVLNTHLSTEDDKRAAVSLGMSFYQALETLFSLLGSYVQAPDCAYAWIAKCSTPDLREVIVRINQEDKTLFSKLRLTDISWKAIPDSIFIRYMPETEKNKITTELFAQLWQRLTNTWTKTTLMSTTA